MPDGASPHGSIVSTSSHFLGTGSYGTVLICHGIQQSRNDPFGAAAPWISPIRPLGRSQQMPWNSTLYDLYRVAPGLWPRCGRAWCGSRQEQEHSWV
jgi:hypothetical protein